MRPRLLLSLDLLATAVDQALLQFVQIVREIVKRGSTYESAARRVAAESLMAAHSAERRREVAALGGKAVPREKRGFAQNRELAREAGRKGGRTPRSTVKSGLTEQEISQVAGSTAIDSEL